MAGEKEVKAQVKLRFYARNRVRMTATRNLMVTAKKAGQTMKTLESLLDAENPNSNKVGTTFILSVFVQILMVSCSEVPYLLNAPRLMRRFLISLESRKPFSRM